MRTSLLDELRLAIASGLRNSTLTTCARWAQARRIMGAPVPGPYTFKYHPWCREIHDADCPYITAKKSAQAGFTEIAINRALFTIDVHKRSVLYVLPTKVPDAADFSAVRFGGALELSPYLASMFSDTNKIDLKQAAGAALYIRGANSESGLKSIPVSELILDEFDEMSEKAVGLALERLSGQIHKHVFMLSTPTIPSFGIDLQYQRSTQEHFYFPCPACSRRIELKWPESFEVCGETPNDPERFRSRILCYECNATLSTHESGIIPGQDGWLDEGKAAMLSQGSWQSTINNSIDHRGFHINQLYSATITPAEIAERYLIGLRSEIAMQEFQNSKLGNAYLASDAQVREEHVEAAVLRGTNLLNDARPLTSRGRIITMGIDQGKWNYVVVAEWFYDTLGYDLNANARCKVLWVGKVGEGDFNQFDRLMREWQVRHCVLDADPNINDARRFARRFPGAVTLCRYRRGVVGREIVIGDEDTGAPMATVDRTGWLDCALGRFYGGSIDLPKDTPIEYREQIKAPARRYETDDDGNITARYIETGPDHYAHAQTYAEIALPLAASAASARSISSFL
jgi:Phage terminase large subunit (GpA)